MRVPQLPEVMVSEPQIQGPSHGARIEVPDEPVREVYEALVLGTRDYVIKNGFTDVLIGLSGGIDSALVAVIAAEALGPEHVVAVLMPSRFSSEGSVTDADALVANLGIRALTVPIERAHAAFIDMLAEPFAGTDEGLAEENLQARVRGTILMTISNKFGWLVLTTGNKSEMATGYSTLYGDMAGGFAVIKDVPKMLVYALARDCNERAGRPLIPEAIIEKPPSAELRPDQRDSDSLPDYAQLDPIVEGYVEDDESAAELRRARATTPTRCGAWHGSSTATSTSAARPRPVCGCRPRRSARTAASPSPTAGPAEPNGPASSRQSSPESGGSRAACGATPLRARSSSPHSSSGSRSRSSTTRSRTSPRSGTSPSGSGSRCCAARAVRGPRRARRGRRPAPAPARRAASPASCSSAATRSRPSGCSTRRRRPPPSSPGCTSSSTPIIESVVRRHLPALSVCAGIVVATVGLFLLTGAELTLGKGELLTLGCALTFAVWIVYQGAYANRIHPLPFMNVQMAMRRGAVRPGGRGAGHRPPHRDGVVRDGVHRRGVLGGGAVAAALRPETDRAEPRRADPACRSRCSPASPGTSNGERLGAVELVGAAVILAGIGISEFLPGP